MRLPTRPLSSRQMPNPSDTYLYPTVSKCIFYNKKLLLLEQEHEHKNMRPELNRVEQRLG
jgi:hypothetical protein